MNSIKIVHIKYIYFLKLKVAHLHTLSHIRYVKWYCLLYIISCRYMLFIYLSQPISFILSWMVNFRKQLSKLAVCVIHFWNLIIQSVAKETEKERQ